MQVTTLLSSLHSFLTYTGFSNYLPSRFANIGQRILLTDSTASRLLRASSPPAEIWREVDLTVQQLRDKIFVLSSKEAVECKDLINTLQSQLAFIKTSQNITPPPPPAPKPPPPPSIKTTHKKGSTARNVTIVANKKKHPAPTADQIHSAKNSLRPSSTRQQKIEQRREEHNDIEASTNQQLQKTKRKKVLNT